MSSLPFPSQLPWLSRNWPVPACTSSILILDGEDHEPVRVVSKEGLLGEVCRGPLAQWFLSRHFWHLRHLLQGQGDLSILHQPWPPLADRVPISTNESRLTTCCILQNESEMFSSFTFNNFYELYDERFPMQWIGQSWQEILILWFTEFAQNFTFLNTIYIHSIILQKAGKTDHHWKYKFDIPKLVLKLSRNIHTPEHRVRSPGFLINHTALKNA